jgi:hypothetical protein
MKLILGLLSLLAPQDSLVIEHANVIPMDTERVLADHAVVIEDGVIRWVGPTDRVQVPEGRPVLDAAGAYLLPGLTDAHVHVRHEDELLLNLANGVTTVMNLSGDPGHLALRERIRAGELLGPTILTAGPTLDGSPARNPSFVPIGNAEQAFAAVAAQKAAGYDFLKVYDLITADNYFAVVEAASEHDLTIVGHIPKEFGLEPTLEGHRMIAHAEEYYYTFFESRSDESRLSEAAALTAEADVALCPNIGFIHAILDQAHDIDEVLARPEVRYVHPDTLQNWLPENNRYVGRPAEWLARNERMYPFLVKLTKAMHDAGVVLMSGTDASVPGGVPGFALHNELDELVAAGLSPYEAVQSATSNPGSWMSEHLGAPELGQVAVGYRADLVLVDSNPLEDVTQLRHPRVVIVRGRRLDGDELRDRLEALAASYRD